MIKARYRFLLVSLFFATLYSLGSSAIKFSYLDALFLDLKNLVAAKSFQNSDILFASISSEKESEVSISADKFLKILRQLDKQGPRMIVVALGPAEISGTPIQLKNFYAELRKLPNVYLYSRWGMAEDASFLTDEFAADFPRSLVLKLSIDTKLGPMDNKIRRFVISMNGQDHDQDLKDFSKKMRLDIPLVGEFDGTFQIYESKQFFIKYFKSRSIAAVNLNEKAAVDVSSKIVFVGSSDHHSSMMSLNPIGRFDFEDQVTSRHLMSEVEYLITVYENLRNLDYIREPPKYLNILWISLFMFLNLILLQIFSSQPATYVKFSFLVLPLIFGLNLIIFLLTNYNFDVTRTMIGSLGIQYLGVPFLFIKYLRKLDKEKSKAERQIEQKRTAMKFTYKVAKADLALSMAAKVSHDLRSPIMALQVTSSLLKGKISDDIQSLLVNSMERISHIAEDTLEIYRGTKKKASDSLDVYAVISELLESYRHLHPTIGFSVSAEGKSVCELPVASVQRIVSNILNNAVEASARNIKVNIICSGNVLAISISNDGQLIPPEVRAKLFQERSTFGKVQGTGLGLYQVRQEVEAYGGSVSIGDETDGTSFKIEIPQEISFSPPELTGRILILEPEDREIYFSLKRRERYKDSEICAASTADEFRLRVKSIEKEEWTLLIDISFEDGPISAFDLLQEVSKPRLRLILFSNLAENLEIQKIATALGAKLVARNTLL